MVFMDGSFPSRELGNERVIVGRYFFLRFKSNVAVESALPSW